MASHLLVEKFLIAEYLSDMKQVFFALCAGILVQEYSVYAKHSGIPEIKTVLGGFVIRRFLGTWTLVTKSVGLVSFAAWRASKRCADQIPVPVSCFWHVAGERRSLGPRRLLLLELVHQVFS